MFDVRWLSRFSALIAVITAGPGGVIEAAFDAIDEAAHVSEWADRGPQFSVGEASLPTSTPYVLPVKAWAEANPDACAEAMADPFAADA
ncbi:MAG: hypothetical protein WKF60_08715 [Ilumatobacter sp.]